MADIKNLIGAIVNRDALSARDIFSDIIGDKVAERIEAIRPAIVDDMFNEAKMKCDECGYSMAKEDSNCKKCGCSMNEAHNSDHIFTYRGKGGYYGGSSTYVYANPKGDKHERFQVVHQGPDKGGEHGTPAAKVSYHPDALSAQKHAEKLAGKGAERVREEVEINEAHNSDHIFTYHGPGGYYGGSSTYVYANPKGDKNQRFQVVHQGPDQGGEHGMPRMKVSYHPDALSAQKHAEKLAGKGAERVREEKETRAYLDWDDRDNNQNVRSLEKIIKKHGGRVTSAGGPGNNSSITFQGGKNNLHARIASKLARAGTNSRTREIAEGMAGYTATSEPTKGGHSAVVKDSKGQTRYAGGSVYSSPEHAVKGAKAYIDAGGGEYGSDMERSHHKHVTMMAKEEYELDELSRGLLGRYATKALQRGDIASRMSNSDSDGMGKIANKRFAGVKLAAKKIATSAGAGKATATAVGKNVDKARTAGMGASTLSNKDREDSGKAYYAAQRNITKLRNMGEDTELDEAGMPSGVASHKTMLRNMSDADFAASPHYGKMTDDTLRSMAWGHGYGKPGTPGHNHYVNKKKDGLKALATAEKKD
jgi:hypothetical protein